jgi:uncharacterized protein (TIGR01777 family)
MKIIVSGGSGQVGTIVARAFHARGDEVVVLSRKPAKAPWRMTFWDGRSPGAWHAELEGADAVINLAGRSVNCRYHARNRCAIMDSRVQSTRILGEALARCERPPRVWLQAGTATIYAHRYDAPDDEATGILGGEEPNAPDTWRFSVNVAKAWEAAFNNAQTPATRKVVMRSAMIMSPDPGGVFAVLLRLVRFGLGGRIGDGRQYDSWIHDLDFIRAVRQLMEDDSITGPVNLASPNPLPQAEFVRELREARGDSFGLPTPKWLLEFGAFVLRTESELVLKSRRVVPGRLLKEGFTFQFPLWRDAARDLCRRWRAAGDTTPSE